MSEKKQFSKAGLIVIFIAFTVAYLATNYTQYQLSPLGADIMAMFDLTPVQFNSLFTAPMLPAVFTSIICGLLVDKYGYKPVLAFSLIMTALGAWLRVFSATYAMMFLAMFLIGFSGGFITSNSSKVLSQIYGQEKVPVLMGLALTFSTCSLVLAMSTTTHLGGITNAFIVAGVVCSVALVLWLLIMPNIKPQKAVGGGVAAEDDMTLMDQFRTVAKNKYVWMTGIILYCICGAMAGTGSTVPVALQIVRGVSANEAGVIGSMMMVGNLLGSLITPTIIQKTGKFRLIMMICGVVSAVTCAFAWRAPMGIAMYLMMIAMGYTFGSGMAMMLSVFVRLPGVGPRLAGSAGGLAATIQLLGGVTLPTYVASGIAGADYSLYFVIIGISSLVWVVMMGFMPKSLDVKQ